MIQSLQMRVHKLAQQIVLRNLGPCMKNAHVVEKRWPLVNGLMEKWAEEERMELLNEDADPAAAVAEIVPSYMVYPTSQAEQSIVAASHNVPPDPVTTVGVPFGQVQTSIHEA